MTAFSSCTNIDCPLSNSVSAKYMFYDSSSRASVVLKDTLTVKAASIDTVLFNRGVNLTEVNLPMSYRLSADTLLFCISISSYVILSFAISALFFENILFVTPI